MNEYNPQTVLPPLNTLKEYLKERNMSIREFCTVNWIAPIIILEIEFNHAEITENLAKHLEDCIGISKQFWLNKQKRYTEFLNEQTQ